MESSTKKSIAIISLILFIEGFVGLSYQMLYIRQLSPLVGNSVQVISWIVGVFLIALAIGYKVGGNVNNKFEYHLSKNFLLSAIIGGFGLTFFFVRYMFGLLGSIFDYYTIMIIYCLIIIAPTTYFLGQTVPIMTNMMKGNSVSQISGNVLFLSTIGSFLGAIITTNVFLKYLGVSFTIFISTLMLFILYSYFEIIRNRNVAYKYTSILVSIILSAILFTAHYYYEKKVYLATNQYANYELVSINNGQGKGFQSNDSLSSVIMNDGSKIGYINIIDSILFRERKLENKDILVVGAGGFVLSEGIANNRFDYVDIDPMIKDVVEKSFLKHNVNGHFIPEDGRSYLNQKKKLYDVIFLDAFVSYKSIPEHMATTEYFKLIKDNLKPDGIFAVNVIGNRDFTSTYTRNMFATINSQFPFCFIHNIDYRYDLANIIFICQKTEEKGSIYTDNKNNANSDYWGLKINE